MGNETRFADHLLSTEAIARLEMRARLPGIAFPEMSDLFIYVIGSGRGPVKIGISCNPLMRMRQLQTSTPERRPSMQDACAANSKLSSGKSDL